MIIKFNMLNFNFLLLTSELYKFIYIIIQLFYLTSEQINYFLIKKIW